MNSFTLEASFHSYFTDTEIKEFESESYKELGMKLGLTIWDYYKLLETDRERRMNRILQIKEKKIAL